MKTTTLKAQPLSQASRLALSKAKDYLIGWEAEVERTATALREREAQLASLIREQAELDEKAAGFDADAETKLLATARQIERMRPLISAAQRDAAKAEQNWRGAIIFARETMRPEALRLVEVLRDQISEALAPYCRNRNVSRTIGAQCDINAAFIGEFLREATIAGDLSKEAEKHLKLLEALLEGGEFYYYPGC